MDMGKNEYESASFVLTNLSDKLMEFEITHGTIGISTTLRKAIWVTVDDGTQINDALSLIDDGRVVIPSGESLEIWITLYGNDVAAGQYNQTINILPKGLKSRTVNILVSVRDISLPKRIPLALGYGEAIVATWPTVTPELMEAYMKDLKSHYVNNARVHPDPIPKLAVGTDGQLVTDYTDLDRTLDGWRTLAPDRFIFFWASESFLEPSGKWHQDHPESIGRPEFMTPQWKNLFRQWLTGWVTHMKDRGIGYDAIVMHPYDERGGPKVQAMIKLIKEVDPKILVLFNGALGRSAEEIEKNIAPYVDIWKPYLYFYLDAGGVNGGIGQKIPLKPNTDYTLSFWGKNGGASIYWDLAFDGSTPRKATGVDAARWRKETYNFTTAGDTTQAEIRFFPTIGNKTMLIDDVVLCSKSGTNLITDGDMEAENLSTSWPTRSAIVIANTTDPHSGSQCAEIKNIPMPPGPVKKVAKRLLGADSGKLFWTYINPIGIGPTKASPYHAYRLGVWRTWKEGMTGLGFWKYNDARWDSTGKGPNWAVVYRSDAADCPVEVSKQELVIPSKRWEATREGVEDYTYLYLLKQAIGKASPKDAAKAKKLLDSCVEKVLKDENNPSLADQAKKQILEQLVKISDR